MSNHHSRVIGRALDGLRAAKVSERRKAVLALQRVGGAEVIAPLTAALQDPDLQIRSTAALALGSIGAHEAVPALVALAQFDASAYVRAMCLGALSLMNSPRLFDAAIHALGDNDERIVYAACSALGRSGDKRAGGGLRQALKHPSWGVRFRAAEELVRLGVVDDALISQIQILDSSDEAAHWNQSAREMNALSVIGRDPAEPFHTTSELLAEARARL